MKAVRFSWFRRLAGLAFVLLALLIAGQGTGNPTSGVHVMRVDGPIGPATVDYLLRGFELAARENAGLIVVEMDTPGGLDTSMRLIIKSILASPVPIATFVFPEGARAASAGTYILYASHVAAMAPATNLGAATPVSIGIGGGSPQGTGPERDDDDGGKKDDEKGASGRGAQKSPSDPMAAKSVEDATAYIRGLAQLRGRNADFAERAVREAASLSAEDALAQEVIDVVAPNLTALLAQLDGRELTMAGGKRVLATANALVAHHEPDWRNRILATLVNPQVALILMMIGMYGLFFEFTSPGFGVPGVAGAISLLMAFYAFQLLPVNWAGVLLLAFGAALMLAEAFVPSFGVLGVGGIVAFIVGGLFLMDTEAPGFGVPTGLVVGLALASVLVVLAIGAFAARSRKRPVVSGREEMSGALGTVIGPAEGGGWWVSVHGESWRAHSQLALVPGMRVRVDRLDGLVVEVSPVAEPSTYRSSSP